MPCYRPVTAWRSMSTNQGTGKRPLVFTRKNAQPGSQLQVPCGRCIGCRLDRSRSWSTRIMHERHQHDLAVFLTLTYNDHFLPEGSTLVKRHMQLFFKRLRDHHRYYGNTNKIKYFMCGEYGGKTQRPHYHAIVFGLDFADKKFSKLTPKGEKLYTSEKLDDLWGFGHCWIGTVTHQSAGYVARYCLDKINGELALEHYKRVNLQTGEVWSVLPEFQASSQGLGLAHFQEHHHQMYLRDSCIVAGKEVPVPKYYDKKLEQIDPDRMAQIKETRKQKAKLRAADTTDDRLAIREFIRKEKTKNLVRTLYV